MVNAERRMPANSGVATEGASQCVVIRCYALCFVKDTARLPAISPAISLGVDW